MPTIDKNQLMNDIRSILAGKVGFYGFPDGTTQAAIAFLPDEKFGYKYPPPNVTRAGVECVVISPRMEVSPRNYSTTQIFDRWQIFLKQWDLSVDIINTAETLVAGLAQSEYRYGDWIETPASEDLGLIRTMSLNIQDFFVLVP